jgi:hypothetical protein
MYKNNSGMGASSKPFFYIFIFCAKTKRCISKSATFHTQDHYKPLKTKMLNIN